MTVDADGVALAAIQGLHQIIRDKDARSQQQDREIASLKRELAAIKARLGM